MTGLDPVAVAALAQSDDRIVVTGAGGWLGMATLDLLRDALGDAFDRRVVAFGSVTRPLHLRNGIVVQRPLAEIASLPRVPTRVLHYAFLTKDRAAAMSDAVYARACRDIRTRVLGSLDAIGATAVFVASSGAAARADDPAATREMRVYGAMKREDETAFAAWGTDAGRRAVIARVFNLAGPYINKPGAYALASFIEDALAWRPIEVRAPRAVVRGYVATRELVSLALATTLTGEGVTRFDTGGEELELGAVAERVALVLGGVVARAKIIRDDADIYLGDDIAYARLRARHGVTPVSLDAAIAETAAYLDRARLAA